MRLTLSVVLAAHLFAGAAAAQQFGAALGPAFPTSPTPATGVHARAEALLLGGRRTFNILTDAHVTRLLPATVASQIGIGSLPPSSVPADIARSEWQVGASVSGVLTLFPSRRFSPYILAGVTVRHSWLNERADFRDPRDQSTGRADFSFRDVTGDLLLGGGTWFEAFGRPLRAEVRVYGGSAINVPVTIALPF